MNFNPNWISRASPTVLKILLALAVFVKQVRVGPVTGRLVPAMQGTVAAMGLVEVPVTNEKTCSPSSELDGKSKFARLKRLNTSARNWRLRFSSIRNCFTTEKSTVL